VSAGAGIAAQVRHVEYLGDQSVVYCSAPGTDGLVAARHAPGLPAPLPGSAVQLVPDPAHCHLFDSHGQAMPRAGARL
jgi:multiple sugar transport system ATP-binding protein